MKIEFQKMHGTKNDFVVLHDLENGLTFTPLQVARLCDRRSGVGADGLIVVRPSKIADFFMDYVNSDGSLAEMCGNGIRCLGKYVYDNGLTEKTSLTVETRAGLKGLDLLPTESGKISSVRVDMGMPTFDPDRIPVSVVNFKTPIIDYPLVIEGETFSCAFVSMGNPHCVIVYDKDDLDEAPRKFGPAIENHEMFPVKTNVEFVKVLNRSRTLMRVWERGSGETLACGTGACASVVTTILKGLTDNQVSIELLGGTLDITWKSTNNPVVMTGAADTVYYGQITL
ncbi:MAG: diaminopimelate epimerase [Pseudomonadota bacterium]